MSEENNDFKQLMMNDFGSKDKRVAYRRILEEITDLMKQEEFDTTRIQAPQDIHKTVQNLVKEVEAMKNKQMITDVRLEQIEFGAKLVSLHDKIDKISDYLIKEFTDLVFVRSIAYSPIDGGLAITVVHDMEDNVQALTQIQKYMSHVKQAFSEVYFELWLLHVSEIEPDHLKNIRIILQR